MLQNSDRKGVMIDKVTVFKLTLPKQLLSVGVIKCISKEVNKSFFFTV